MKKLTRKQLIKSYLDFFKLKNHSILPSSSLIPENDPTVLFTTAGMQPLVPYLLGQKHPLGKRLVNVQKCIRTVDIEEVGDTYHHTFFEMLGNWSLGDYWKKEAIKLTFEFLTKSLSIDSKKLAVSVFAGDKKIKKDLESFEIWKSLGIPEKRIAFLKGNWWGPAGNTGPCGPNTEVFYWKSSSPAPEKFNSEDETWVEIGNDVLMEFNKNPSNKFEELSQKNIDFGGGVERTLAILNGFEDNYLTEIWIPIIKQIEKISKKTYLGNENKMRIIADHLKASVFILAEKKVTPSNTERGYVLRRLIRRAIRYGKLLGIEKPFTKQIALSIFPIYPDYEELSQNKKFILNEIEKEEQKFNKTLSLGLKKFEKFSKNKIIDGKQAFLLFQSFGFPIEMTQELAKEKNIKVDIKNFEKELKNHQELSRTSSAGQFKSGLADSSEKTRRLHTATHLLNAALQEILKDKNIKQKGSNINPERLRFDFNFPRKLTNEELQEIEQWVNERIKELIPVTREEMPLEKAFSSGAQGEFGAKYPDIVSVYTIGKYSKEICTGPHVSNTSEIGKFKILKESSSSAGIRRIKATVLDK
jgi:alanyl-tRNA synthetase